LSRRIIQAERHFFWLEKPDPSLEFFNQANAIAACAILSTVSSTGSPCHCVFIVGNLQAGRRSPRMVLHSMGSRFTVELSRSLYNHNKPFDKLGRLRQITYFKIGFYPSSDDK
jgi:hypothetical protein